MGSDLPSENKTEKHPDAPHEVATKGQLIATSLDLLKDWKGKAPAPAGSEIKLPSVTLTEAKLAPEAKSDGKAVASAKRDEEKELPPEYVKEKAEYDKVHGEYEKKADKYWDSIKQARNASPRRFITDFAPMYSGPAEPKLPPGFEDTTKKPPAKPSDIIPSTNDIIRSSRELQRSAFGDSHKPDFKLSETTEDNFKQRYAAEALRIGRQFGFKDDVTAQIVKKIYAFEDGGWGTHDTWSSMPESLTAPDIPGSTKIYDERHDYHATGVGASTAIGYNQLIMLNSLDNLHLKSAPIAARLQELAKEEPARAKELSDKAAMVTALGPVMHKELMAMANEEAQKPASDPTKKVYLDKDGDPNDDLLMDFSKSKELTSSGISRQDLARGVHALNLDSDIGPILQARELGNVFATAQKAGYESLLAQKAADAKTASDAYDALPLKEKEQAVHDLLSLVKTSATDPAAKHEFATTKQRIEAKLLALKPGSDPALSVDKLPQADALFIQNNILTLKRHGEKSGPLKQDTRELLDKISFSHLEITGDKLLPAAVELANLAGGRSANVMLIPANSELPTSNFFSRGGYERNPVVNQRTSDEVLMYIHRVMIGPRSDASKHPGVAAFDAAFAKLANKQP